MSRSTFELFDDIFIRIANFQRTLFTHNPFFKIILPIPFLAQEIYNCKVQQDYDSISASITQNRMRIVHYRSWVERSRDRKDGIRDNRVEKRGFTSLGKRAELPISTVLTKDIHPHYQLLTNLITHNLHPMFHQLLHCSREKSTAMKPK